MKLAWACLLTGVVSAFASLGADEGTPVIAPDAASHRVDAESTLARPEERAGAQGAKLMAVGEAFLRNQLRTYLADRGAGLVSRTSLMQMGIGAQNDAVEQAFQSDGRWVVPHHIGRAVPAEPPQRTVDPAVLEGARGTAQRRLGRVPTTVEVQVEVTAFDQRIAQVNRELASRRVEIAAAYKRTGQFPCELEATVLGVPPRTVVLDQLKTSDWAALKAAITTMINNAAADAPVPVPVRR